MTKLKEILEGRAAHWREAARDHPDPDSQEAAAWRGKAIGYQHAADLAKPDPRFDRILETLPELCWISLNAEVRCTEFITGIIGDGPHTWTFEMCCVPCQVRHIIEESK